MAATSDELSHHVLFYRDEAEYVAHIAAFARGGLTSAEPVLIALPGSRSHPVSAELEKDSRWVSFFDMAQAGRNPARIISELGGFIARHAGQRVRFICEPTWLGRSPAELREAARHEALTNLAFADAAVTIECLYHLGLASSIIGTAWHTHPGVVQDGQPKPNDRYAGAGQLPPDCDRPLQPPPPNAASLMYHADLRSVRGVVGDHASRCGLSADQTANLVLAVSELAANTLRHTGGGGTVHVWRTSHEILCQIDDKGWIPDPLAGRTRRPATERGHGLWVVNQMCDLVELRTGQGGTKFRLHMRLPQA